MPDDLFALLIHDKSGAFKELEEMLKDLSVETWTIRNCERAESVIAQYKPLMAFVESSIWDAACMELVNLSKRLDLALSIIVVGPVPDIELYVDAIERGAFSFVAPPFAYDGLNVVVHSAAMDARDRRESLVRAQVEAYHAHAL